MNLSSPRVLLYSLLGGVSIGLVAGVLYAVLGSRSVVYAVGTMLAITGVVALALGLLGAVEPEDGWATGIGRNREQRGRRSFASKVTEQHPKLEQSESWALAIWGLVVGLSLIGLAVLAFAVDS